MFDYSICKPNYSPGAQELDLRVAAVEIKKAVGRETVGRGTIPATPDLIICETRLDEFTQQILKEHAAQIIHQCFSCNMKWVFYIQATESQVMYVLLIACTTPLRTVFEEFYDTQITPALRWAHIEQVGTQLLTADDEIKKLVSTRVPFWRMISNEISAKGPFVPVHIIKHASQTLYNKTKGGVDGNEKMRATLRCLKDTLKWEQKVVTEILKSVTVNTWGCMEAVPKRGHGYLKRGV